MRKLLIVLGVAALVLAPAVAFAQSAPSSAQPALTAASAVVLILSLLLGFVTNSVQSGSLLGIKTVPQTWLPGLTIFSTLLGGIVAYLTSHPSLDGATVFYAVAQGLAALLASSVPALATHAHVTLPAARFARRQSVKLDSVTRAALGASLMLLVGCTAAQVKSNTAVAVDITNAVCSVAADSPVGQPFTDIICTIAGATEQGIGLLADGTPTAATLSSAPPTIQTIRIRLPTAQAADFLAQHAAH